MFCKFYWRCLICLCCTPLSMQTHVSLNWIPKRAPSEISMVIKIVNLKMLAWCFDACEVYEAVGRKKQQQGHKPVQQHSEAHIFSQSCHSPGPLLIEWNVNCSVLFCNGETNASTVCVHIMQSFPLQHRQGTRAVVVDSCDWQVV